VIIAYEGLAFEDSGWAGDGDDGLCGWLGCG
jgi:hypothetical protein